MTWSNQAAGKCNPKTKTYFSFAFLLRNSKSGKNYLLEIWMRIQNMFALYDTKRILQIGEKNLTGNFKNHLWRSSCVVKVF